ncbi:MAG: lamin tail domain-containing protein [Candidatus Aenigmarchaeota archaeon]|nr:lamin tail domain-containing protein [Candidatus Aenigmarchaeota archaeon]
MRGKTRKWGAGLNLFAVLFFSYFLVNVGFGATLNSYGTISTGITILDNVPPEILNVTYLVATPGEPNNRSVTIRWETDELTNSTVEFFEGENWVVKASNSSFVEKHKIKISGLSEGNYTFRVNSSDKAGNWDISEDYNFTIEKPAGITEHLVINEISLGANNFEWVELYNPTDEDINLSEEDIYLVYYTSGRNWNNSYRPAGDKKKLSGIIPAGRFYLVKIDGNGTTEEPNLVPNPDYDWEYAGDARTLNDNKGSIAIFPFDPDTKTAEEAKTGRIDAVAWGSVNYVKEGLEASKPDADESIERKLPGYDTDNNSADFIIRETPTPTNSSPSISLTADIVLNEFLPIAGNYSEFIEFYNKGNSGANMENWTIEIESYGNFTINESVLYSGFDNATIGIKGSGNEWLVIDLSKVGIDLLGENDTITLYDNESMEIDKVSYTNATMQDKSYARIPDGNPNWVDPIPTPGKPNKLENQTIDEQLNETGGNQTENQTDGINETLPKITIISPENKTYNLTEIELIVEIKGEIRELWYSLNNEEKVGFEENITINALEETNYLVVYANTSFGVINEEVYFSVNISGENLDGGEENLTNTTNNSTDQTNQPDNNTNSTDQTNQPDNNTNSTDQTNQPDNNTNSTNQTNQPDNNTNSTDQTNQPDNNLTTQTKQTNNTAVSPDVSNIPNNSVTQGNDSDEINNQVNTPDSNISHEGESQENIKSREELTTEGNSDTPEMDSSSEENSNDLGESNFDEDKTLLEDQQEETEMVEGDSGEEMFLDDKQEETGGNEQTSSSEEELQEETGSEEGNSDGENTPQKETSNLNVVEDEMKTAKVEEENVDEVEKIEKVNDIDIEEEIKEYIKEIEEPADSGVENEN